MKNPDSTRPTGLIRNGLAPIIRNILTTGDVAEADRLIEKAKAQSYRNPTLTDGDSGCILALLQLYERTREARYLACSRGLLDTLYLNYQQISLGQGLAGTLTAWLYYYYLTGEQAAVEKARQLSEKLVAQIKVCPGRYYLPAGTANGTTGIWLVLLACRPLFHSPDPVDRLIVRLLEYENDYLEKNKADRAEIRPDTLAEINRVRAWALTRQPGQFPPEIAELCQIHTAVSKGGQTEGETSADTPSIGEAFPDKPAGEEACASENIAPEMMTSLLAILQKTATLPPCISLDLGQIAYQQVYTYFPRVLDKTPQPFDFADVWDADVVHTCFKFRDKVAGRPEQWGIDPHLYQLENFKFGVELEIRKQPKKAFWEAEKKENEAIFKATMLDDSLFENIPLTVADNVHMITLSHYVTKAPEIEIHPAKSYLAVFKPTLLADYDYVVVEDCLQGLGALIRSIAKYGKPITPAALAALMATNQTTDKEETYQRIIRSLRKFTFRRFLKPVNA